jgi:hypothetical protein
MGAQELLTGNGHRNEAPSFGLMTRRDEPPVVGVLPNGKARTRRPPGVEYLDVGARVRADPFEKVENQRLECVRHEVPMVVDSCPRR